MKVKEESEKVGLKLIIQETKNMASSPITSWQIDGETVETVTDFNFGAPKSLQMVTAAPWTEEPGGTVHGITKSQTRLSDKHTLHQ